MTSLRVRRQWRATSRGRRVALLAALAGLFFGTVVTAAPSVAEQPITPLSILVTVSTDTSDIGGALPAVLAEVDNGDPNDTADELTVDLALDPPGATFNTDTQVTFAPVQGTGTGVFTPSKVVFPKDQTTAHFTGITYSKVENGIKLAATAGKGNKAISGSSLGFDIQYSVLKEGPTPDPFTLGDQDCTQTTSHPLCAVALLTNGLASTTGAALAIGACTTYYPCSSPDGRVVSFMADLTGAYSHEYPATIIMRCDKTYCKGGGVRSYTIKATVAWGDLNFLNVPACEVKGEVQAGTKYCVDYVQSHRDNAGDLLLYWLIGEDVRGII